MLNGNVPFYNHRPWVLFINFEATQNKFDPFPINSLIYSIKTIITYALYLFFGLNINSQNGLATQSQHALQSTFL